jgi:exopolysaccharide biosynthesis protein
MIHIVEIDLRSLGIDFLVTPGDSTKGLEVPARTTSAFLEEFDVQVAINGGFSKPFRAGTFLWDYYPHSGDPVDVTGVAISNSKVYSDDHEKYPAICITNGYAEISQSGCPEGTAQALAGNRVLVQDGESVIQVSAGTLHPRTAVAVDKAGETLWLIVVDGRQQNYSEGVTLAELAGIAVELGADRALNLDGGGSSTLVMARDRGAKVLNAPIHTRVPMRERPVANHLGVYAQPVDE